MLFKNLLLLSVIGAAVASQKAPRGDYKDNDNSGGGYHDYSSCTPTTEYSTVYKTEYPTVYSTYYETETDTVTSTYEKDYTYYKTEYDTVTSTYKEEYTTTTDIYYTITPTCSSTAKYYSWDNEKNTWDQWNDYNGAKGWGH